ncbi:hypothetical protein MRX96_033303 [Rhipicephalus microplus]
MGRRMPSALRLVKKSVPLSVTVCAPSECAAVCHEPSSLKSVQCTVAEPFEHDGPVLTVLDFAHVLELQMAPRRFYVAERRRGGCRFSTPKFRSIGRCQPECVVYTQSSIYTMPSMTHPKPACLSSKDYGTVDKRQQNESPSAPNPLHVGMVVDDEKMLLKHQQTSVSPAVVPRHYESIVNAGSSIIYCSARGDPDEPGAGQPSIHMPVNSGSQASNEEHCHSPDGVEGGPPGA